MPIEEAMVSKMQADRRDGGGVGVQWQARQIQYTDPRSILKRRERP